VFSHYAKAMKVTRLVTLSVVLALASTADARPRPKSFGEGSKRFEANKTFGLGLELGYPDGLTGKYFLNDSNALQFGLGWAYRHYYGGDGLHLYADYLWHPFVLTSAEPFELPFYIGVGGHFWDFDYGCDRFGRNCGSDGQAVGVRVPIGIAFDFNNVPLDIFIQVVPTLDFFRSYDRNVWLTFWVSLGIRFWFN
jgi:hypothetical protein